MFFGKLPEKQGPIDGSVLHRLSRSHSHAPIRTTLLLETCCLSCGYETCVTHSDRVNVSGIDGGAGGMNVGFLRMFRLCHLGLGLQRSPWAKGPSSIRFSPFSSFLFCSTWTTGDVWKSLSHAMWNHIWTFYLMGYETWKPENLKHTWWFGASTFQILAVMKQCCPPRLSRQTSQRFLCWIGVILYPDLHKPPNDILVTEARLPRSFECFEHCAFLQSCAWWWTVLWWSWQGWFHGLWVPMKSLSKFSIRSFAVPKSSWFENFMFTILEQFSTNGRRKPIFQGYPVVN